MIEIGWKSAALCAALAVFGMFSGDMAPSQLNWSAVTGMWAFVMVVALVWSRGAYPNRPVPRNAIADASIAVKPLWMLRRERR
jgi:hypothetical protein